MPLLLLLLAVVAPRVVFVVVALFTTLLARAYDNWLLPALGFFFLPLTTLAYAWAVHVAGGVRGTTWLVVMVLAILLDVGGSVWRFGRGRPVAI